MVPQNAMRAERRVVVQRGCSINLSLAGEGLKKLATNLLRTTLFSYLCKLKCNIPLIDSE